MGNLETTFEIAVILIEAECHLMSTGTNSRMPCEWNIWNRNVKQRLAVWLVICTTVSRHNLSGLVKIINSHTDNMTYHGSNEQRMSFLRQMLLRVDRVKFAETLQKLTSDWNDGSGLMLTCQCSSAADTYVVKHMTTKVRYWGHPYNTVCPFKQVNWCHCAFFFNILFFFDLSSINFVNTLFLKYFSH